MFNNNRKTTPLKLKSEYFLRALALALKIEALLRSGDAAGVAAQGYWGSGTKGRVQAQKKRKI